MPLLLFGRDLVVIVPLSIVFLFAYTLCQATTSRYRVDQAFKVYIYVMIFVLIEFLLMIRGIIWV